ncbi:MAG TPA: MFS transporter [Methylomirabilota bacterium]|nr:MFS transporter [Methylomirabilota bacterium]
MRDWLARLNPFKTPEAKRLAVLFGIVYFAQGMWYLPEQTITIVLKDRGLSASQVADFILIAWLPWFAKPLYGLLSDFVPLFGRRRQSYFVVSSAVAGVGGLALAWGNWIATGEIWTFDLFGLTTFTVVQGFVLFFVMSLGLAFTDVLTDAMMVENGRPLGLTGAFQSVQWACITLASVLVGELGGQLAETRSLRAAFLVAACFPLMSLSMGLTFVRETPTRASRAAFLETWQAIRAALGGREIWLVAGFIFFFWFSPSFGPAFLYYQTDTLHFSQQFIGRLAALGALSGVVGAFLYAPLSRRLSLKRIMHLSIALGVLSTLSYLAYRDTVSAVVITIVFGAIGMIFNLGFLDLAAKSCPPRVEATFFAALMSILNAATKLSENVGARLYEVIGYERLVYIAAGMTALTWLLMPLVKFDQIEESAASSAGIPRDAAT